MNIDTTALETLFDTSPTHLDAAQGIASAYQLLLGGVPSIDGFTALINNAISTNFGAGGTTAFNQENVFINVANSLVQGNTTAAANFATLIAGQSSLSGQVTALYNALVPAASRTAEGLAFVIRPEALQFYQDVAAERGVAGGSGPAIVAMASLANVFTESAVPGHGDSVNDLIAAIRNDTSMLPQGGDVFTPIETADGTGFDGNDVTVDPTAGSTFTLTTSTDAFTGTANDDTFNAVVDATTPANGTSQAGDSVDGGAGNDTFLMRVVDTGFSAANTPTLTNIETLQIDAVVATAADLSGIAPNLTSVVVNNPLAAVTITNAPTAVNMVTLQNVAQNNADLSFTSVAGLTSGTDDALTLTLSGASAAAPGTAGNFAKADFVGAAADDGFDKVSVVSNGSANRLDRLQVEDSAASTMDSLTITGTQDFRVNDALDFSGTTGTIDSTAATGKINLNVGTEDITATFGAGDDRLGMGTAGDLTVSDTIDMGAGTDTFAWAETATSMALNTTLSARVMNFERLEFTAATTAIDMDLTGGANTIVQSGDAAAGFAVTDLENDDFVEISGDPAGASSFAAKLDNGSNVLNLTLDSSTFGGNVDAGNFETINLATAGSAGSAITGFTLTVGTNAVINLTGSQDMDLGTLVGTNASLSGAMFTGDITVIGEAGNNTFTVGTGTNSIRGMDGVDSFTLNSGADTIILTDDDSVDTIAGFTGGGATTSDVLSIDVSDFTAELGAGQLVDSSDDVAGGDAVVVHSITSGDTDPATSVDAGANIIKFTNTTGVNAFSDLVFDLTLDTNPGDAADAIMTVFWDADDAVARVGYMVDAGAAANANYTNGAAAFTEVATLTGLSTAEYDGLVAGDFSFIA